MRAHLYVVACAFLITCDIKKLPIPLVRQFVILGTHAYLPAQRGAQHSSLASGQLKTDAAGPGVNPVESAFDTFLGCSFCVFGAILCALAFESVFDEIDLFIVQ